MESTQYSIEKEESHRYVRMAVNLYPYKEYPLSEYILLIIFVTFAVCLGTIYGVD